LKKYFTHYCSKRKISKLGANEFAPQTVEIFFAFSQCGSRSISSRPWGLWITLLFLPRNHIPVHLNIEYTTLNKVFLKLHENERMLSLAACSSASISFSKVDKTLRFEAELSNQR
jgi:hypothetical protein